MDVDRPHWTGGCDAAANVMLATVLSEARTGVNQ
jgi:hypothetical protein